MVIRWPRYNKGTGRELIGILMLLILAVVVPTACIVWFMAQAMRNERLAVRQVNGYEICRVIREEGLDMPIIMLTAKGQESDIILGLNIGADDYVTKPFSIRELLARAEAFLRRRRKNEDQTFQFGDYELVPASRKLFCRGKELELTPKEFNLLLFFVKHTGRAMTRDQILSAVWGHDIIVTARSVDRCVTTLRGKIEDDPDKPRYITTVREIGYRFENPTT